MFLVRNIRGLYNGIGNMIKVITGNLDDNDLVKINTIFGWIFFIAVVCENYDIFYCLKINYL